MIQNILKDTDLRMHKAIEAARNELQKIRTGKASTGLLDTVKVDAYGSQMTLTQVGTINISDAHSLSVSPWDKSLIGAIEKGILSANLGLNPQNDGSVIRIPIPPLTEERRKELIKLVKKFCEEGKISIRNIRRDANEHIKKLLKDKSISEDDDKRGESEIQKMTDKFTKEIDNILVVKEKELMEI
ncbi:MAG: ribosome recycling factor [Bacteroidetes bacterium]|nr:ribosome recycling factor [Bacteroidota bacterium]